MNERVRTACPYDCPDTCPLIVSPLPGGLLGIEANPDFTLGSNFICQKGARLDSIRRDPSRLKEPLMKDGVAWRPVSWDEAWSLWAERTMEATERWGPLSVFLSRGSGSLYFSKELIPRVFSAMGGYTTTKGSLCGAAGGAGLERAFGHRPVLLPGTVAENSRGLVLWGRNAAETNVHLLPIIDRIRDRGGRVVSVEVRETPTTRISERTWRVRPEGDGPLALLLCLSLLERGLASGQWRERVLNATAFEEMLLSLDRAEMERRAGLEANDIEVFADWFADSRPVCICPGYGVQRYLSGSDTFHYLAALSALLGGLEEKGGGVLFGKDEMALFPSGFLPRPSLVRKIPVSGWYSTPSCVPPLQVAVFCGANPAKQSPGSEEFADAIQRIGFKVCVDHFMTETARLCDLVLPSAMFMEEGPDWRGSWWHNYVFRSSRVVEPPEGVLTDLEIFTGLSCKMGLGVDLEAERNAMDRAMMSDARLKFISEGLYFWDEPEDWGIGERPFIMPVEPPAAPFCNGGIRLVTVHVKDYINGQVNGTPGEKVRTPSARLSRATMGSLGLSEGDITKIRSSRRALVVRVKVDEGLSEDICVMDQGIDGVNRLTSPIVSPGYGAPYHESLVDILPLEQEAENA